MREQLKILAIVHIILGVLGTLAALCVLVFFGGLAGIARFADQGEDAFVGSAVLGLIGAGLTLLVLIVSIPGLIAGIGLLNYRPWARILTIIISVIELPGFPVHTALGAYGLWVLLSVEGSALFTHP